ncbi:MAG: cell division protein FtsB, partial [Azoarcus sp.]|nr:cell division protein FtsB [Azoarcus sp.]
MRWPVFLLFILVVVLQYPLWLGRGGWLRVWEIDKNLQTRRA